jgi:4-hydroxy-tetrahydrodipicolinate synthase
MSGTTLDTPAPQPGLTGLDLHGVVPPLVTPLDEDGRLDIPSLERLVDHQIGNGVDGLFVAGSSGEVALLDDEARSALVRATVSAAGGRVPVLAGVIDTGTDRVVAHARRAARDGADAVVATPPFYVQPSPAEISDHFRRIAQAADVPLVAYNIPVNVHVALPAETVAELARDGVIAGLKDSSGDLTALRAYLRAAEGTGVRVLTGSETVADVSLQLGAHGVVPGLGNVDPAGYVRLARAAQDGDAAVATSEQERLIRLFRIVTTPSTPGLGGTAAALGAFKAALWLLGVIDHPRTQRPLRPLSAADVDAIRHRLVACGLQPSR